MGTLLTPSWFSYLVSRDIFMKRNNISRLDTLPEMVSAKESSNNRSVCDVVIYKYFSMSSIHVALRAHQFFNSITLRTSSKFYPYNLTKLNSKEKRRSSIVMKNLMKLDVGKLQMIFPVFSTFLMEVQMLVVKSHCYLL